MFRYTKWGVAPAKIQNKTISLSIVADAHHVSKLSSAHDDSRRQERQADVLFCNENPWTTSHQTRHNLWQRWEKGSQTKSHWLSYAKQKRVYTLKSIYKTMVFFALCVDITHAFVWNKSAANIRGSSKYLVMLWHERTTFYSRILHEW